MLALIFLIVKSNKNYHLKTLDRYGIRLIKMACRYLGKNLSLITWVAKPYLPASFRVPCNQKAT